ncbi:uncharacterized protein EAE98_010401 [Botrytis deweyae]|uniref:Mid2 domain-containing protein n=1 Tax=Botrytis deweyae TaxID=2478750 RepID=A0ABQ7I8P4_9HELO|nr:uncharacterized protein EAE98_010401 [Botrytis deweyae]KAF7916970.1 hypothetical protein EAE98_010401 [Botrytis deweyae]
MSEETSTGTSIVQTMMTATLHEPSYITVTSVSTMIASSYISYISTEIVSSIYLYITVSKTVIAASVSSSIESSSLMTLTSRSLTQETIPEPSLTQKSNDTSSSQSLVQETVFIPSPTQSSIATSHQNTTAIVAGALGGLIFVCMLLAGFYFLRGYRLRHKISTKDINGHSILPEKGDGKDPVHEMTGEGKVGCPRQEIEGNSLSELEQGGSRKHQEPVELTSSFPRIGTSYCL